MKYSVNHTKGGGEIPMVTSIAPIKPNNNKITALSYSTERYIPTTQVRDGNSQ